MQSFVYGWLSACIRHNSIHLLRKLFKIQHIMFFPCGRNKDYIFAHSVINLTCKLFMIRGGTLSIFGNTVNDQLKFLF